MNKYILKSLAYIKIKKLMFLTIWLATATISFFYSFIRQIIDTKQLITYNGLNNILEYMGNTFTFLIIALVLYFISFFVYCFFIVAKIRATNNIVNLINSNVIKKIIYITLCICSVIYCVFFIQQIIVGKVLEYNKSIFFSLIATLIATTCFLSLFIHHTLENKELTKHN